MNHFHTKKHTILRRFLCGAMVLALLSPALTFVQPMEAQASYVDTNMNTFMMRQTHRLRGSGRISS